MPAMIGKTNSGNVYIKVVGNVVNLEKQEYNICFLIIIGGNFKIKL